MPGRPGRKELPLRAVHRPIFGTPPLVGRSNELLTLRHAVAEAKRGHGSVVGICGEAGIGKSRLAMQAITSERQACTCLNGRAYTTEGRVPFAVWVDAIAPFLAEQPAETARALVGANPTLRQLFLGATDSAASASAMESSDQGKLLLFVAFRDLLQRIATKRPTILYLDDVHAADQASLELLHFIARGVASLPLLILVTYRDGERLAPGFAPVVESLLANELLAPIKLPPLNCAETQELATAIVGGYVSPSTVSALHERTAGNPLFLHEVLRPVTRRAQASSALSSVPATIAQLIRARLAQLSPDAQAVLTMAAVAGESASLALLGIVADIPQSALVAALDELLQQQCLSEQMERGHLHYSFPHPLLREVVYEGLSAARRASLHDAIGHALQHPELGEAIDAAELAHHLSHSVRRETRRQSLPHLVAAAQRALEVFAHREALDVLERAVEIVEHSDPPELRYAIFERLGRAREWLGGFTLAISAYEEAFENATATEAKAAVLRRMGRCLWQIGDESTAIARFEQGLALLAGTPPSVAAVNLLQEIAQARQRLGDAERAIADNLRSVELAEALGNHQLIARAFLGLLTTYAVTGDMERAEEYGRRALALCTDTAMAPVAWEIHSTYGALLRHRAMHAQASEHLHESLRVADSIGAPALESWPLTILSDECRMAGDLANAVRFGERAVEIDRSYDQQGLLPRSLAFAALAQRLSGNVHVATEYIASALEILRERHKQEIRMWTPVLGADAFLTFLDGDVNAAERKAAALVDYLDTHGQPVLYLLYPLALPLRLELAIRAGRDAALDGGIERLRTLSTRWKHAPAQAAYHYLVALRAGRRSIADRYAFDEALAQFHSLGLRYDVARVLLDKAHLLFALGEAAAAIECVSEGVRLTEEMRVIDVGHAFAALGRKLGIKTGATKRSAGDLTERELEVADLVVRGLTNKQIATELHISMLTAETHVRNILRKTGASSRSRLGEVLG